MGNKPSKGHKLGAGDAGSSKRPQRSFGGGVVGTVQPKKKNDSKLLGAPGAAEISTMIDGVRGADPLLIKPAIDLVLRYLQAILTSPSEPKVRCIRVMNKAFQERLCPVDGIQLFFDILGFVNEERPGPGGDMETFLVLPQDANLHVFRTAKTLLTSYQEEVEAQVEEVSRPPPTPEERITKVFKPPESGAIASFDVPDSFFELSELELRALISKGKNSIREEQVIKTRSLREREKAPGRKYMSALLRVRIPGGLMLQGVFKPTERLQRVLQWINSCVEIEQREYVLQPPAGCGTLDMSKDLQSQNLVPAVVLNMWWADGEQTRVAQLKAEWEGLVEDLPVDQETPAPIAVEQPAPAKAPKPGQPVPSPGADARTMAAEAAAARASGGGGAKKGGMPKWMKTGK